MCVCVCCSIYLLRKESSTKKGVCGDVGCGVDFVSGRGRGESLVLAFEVESRVVVCETCEDIECCETFRVAAAVAIGDRATIGCMDRGQTVTSSNKGKSRPIEVKRNGPGTKP